MKNWTAPGPDMIHAYWLKKLTSLHIRLTYQMEKLVTEGDHPSWLTQGRTVMQDPQQGPIPSNYRPITCLSTTWKLLSGILADKIGVHMDGYMHKAQRGIQGDALLPLLFCIALNPLSALLNKSTYGYRPREYTGSYVPSTILSTVETGG